MAPHDRRFSFFFLSSFFSISLFEVKKLFDGRRRRVGANAFYVAEVFFERFVNHDVYEDEDDQTQTRVHDHIVLPGWASFPFCLVYVFCVVFVFAAL